MRWALTSAIAAATPPSSSSVEPRRAGWSRGGAAGAGGVGPRRCRSLAVAAVVRQPLEQPGQAGQRRQEVAVAALEERAPLRRDGLGILEILVEEQTRVAGVHAVDVMHGYSLL